MKNTKLLLAIATSAALLTGCQNTHGINTDLAISSGLNAYKAATLSDADAKEGANKRGNSSRLTQSFHFFMFEPIFSPVNALNQPI